VEGFLENVWLQNQEGDRCEAVNWILGRYVASIVVDGSCSGYRLILSLASRYAIIFYVYKQSPQLSVVSVI
jgi:hypothetical protein